MGRNIIQLWKRDSGDPSSRWLGYDKNKSLCVQGDSISSKLRKWKVAEGNGCANPRCEHRLFCSVRWWWQRIPYCPTEPQWYLPPSTRQHWPDTSSSTLLSRRRYRSIMAVSKDTPLRRGTWSVTSPKVVVSSSRNGRCGIPVGRRYARSGQLESTFLSQPPASRWAFLQRCLEPILWFDLSEWCVVTSFYQSSANRVPF